MYSGQIKSLWRYPVKSLRGERLDQLELNQRGIIGDRAYAIYDRNEKIGSGKNTRRFRRIDGLIDLSVNMIEDQLVIGFPDGSLIQADAAEIDHRLSDFLGQQVELKPEQSISHFDQGAVHIITTNMLDKLNDLMPEAGIDERRFRPNIVLDLNPKPLDQYLLGETMQIGEVKLKISAQTERCRMATMAQQELEKRPEILKVITRNYDLNFGVYADVINPGFINIGDKVEV